MWYINRGGKTVGPLMFDDLKQMAEVGLIQPADLVRLEGAEKWVEARQVPGLFPAPEEAVGLATPEPEPPRLPGNRVNATAVPVAEDSRPAEGDKPTPIRRKKGLQDEEVFFDEQGILVTSVRFVVHDQTFAMSGITACKFSVEPGVWKVHRGAFGLFTGIMVLVVWALSSVSGELGLLTGAVILAGAFAGMTFGNVGQYRLEDLYWVSLRTAGGEVQALSDHNEQFIRRIVKAVTDAMIARG